MNVTDGVNLTSWPSEEVTIDGTFCMDYDELMEVKSRGDFLKCLTEVTTATTHALDSLGVDAAIIHGSLLGWQRHDRSHIPWDVDADLTIMQSHCQQAFKDHSSERHKNMAALIREYLPIDSYYRVAGIVFGVGSELPPDGWENCDAREFRIIHDYKDVTCHADVFQLLQSNYTGGEECASCPGYNEGFVTTCRELDNSCALYDDFFPMRWDKQDGGDVKVPNRVRAVLGSNFGSLSWELLNLQSVPRNHEFGSSMLVVGRAMMSNETMHTSASLGKLRGPQGAMGETDMPAIAPSISLSENGVNVLASRFIAMNWSTVPQIVMVSSIRAYAVSLTIGSICTMCLILMLYYFFKRNRTDDLSAGVSPGSANSLLNLVDVIKNE
ncbi:hypothetical protein Pmar_PMAR008594 [Perkinsus marinus ATCC 50983]|uniref:LicD/FKTN/FKRP nucleotidyltransferase domain-containing protein n=1 Tax=Perkinsus marinus (strain ATCC 50983 / TXsc) TaxID=423536 RepID=C5L7Y0_PERM5|nr:hypothetical protein Pmar_PMAR008594 [Perkinsus marinus ATCC 50983]EER07160.1 hypothetical protein Pmar_PMAR008594 [Perkinsus marinus ATCC 50983]|eukprot:XP_002775344.1 hypothetical protein Pmar_PMAR008594 [Perkinsus marinus ATCC 50983]